MNNIVHSLVLLLLLCCSSGCGMQRRLFPQPAVFSANVTKEQLVTHLNRNIVGSAGQSGVASWQTSHARLHVTGIPAYLPASIAVEAPRNFRMVVSNPMTGGQEVDIGSNPERFWFWSKESPEIITVRHEDVPLAFQYIRMPVHIHPDWLMEVLGVIPLNPAEFEMSPPRVDTSEVELIANRKSPLGQDMERVVKVDLARGEVREHILRAPNGTVVARARLDDYRPTVNGALLARTIKLYWPAAKMAMTMNLGDVEVNPPALAQNSSLWRLPHIPGARPVDVGAIARMQAREGAAPLREFQLTPPNLGGLPGDAPGRISISSAADANMDNSPSDAPPFPDAFPIRQAAREEPGVPDWARPSAVPKSPTNPVNGTSAFEPPSGYSVKASRSSWDQLPPGQE